MGTVVGPGLHIYTGPPSHAASDTLATVLANSVRGNSGAAGGYCKEICPYPSVGRNRMTNSIEWGKYILIWLSFADTIPPRDRSGNCWQSDMRKPHPPLPHCAVRLVIHLAFAGRHFTVVYERCDPAGKHLPAHCKERESHRAKCEKRRCAGVRPLSQLPTHACDVEGWSEMSEHWGD